MAESKDEKSNQNIVGESKGAQGGEVSALPQAASAAQVQPSPPPSPALSIPANVGVMRVITFNPLFFSRMGPRVVLSARPPDNAPGGAQALLSPLQLPSTPGVSGSASPRPLESPFPPVTPLPETPAPPLVVSESDEEGDEENDEEDSSESDEGHVVKRPRLNSRPG